MEEAGDPIKKGVLWGSRTPSTYGQLENRDAGSGRRPRYGKGRKKQQRGYLPRGSHPVVAYRLKRFVCGVMIASSRNDKPLKIESDAEVHRSFVSLEGLACLAG